MAPEVLQLNTFESRRRMAAMKRALESAVEQTLPRGPGGGGGGRT